MSTGGLSRSLTKCSDGAGTYNGVAPINSLKRSSNTQGGSLHATETIVDQLTHGPDHKSDKSFK